MGWSVQSLTDTSTSQNVYYKKNKAPYCYCLRLWRSCSCEHDRIGTTERYRQISLETDVSVKTGEMVTMV